MVSISRLKTPELGDFLAIKRSSFDHYNPR